MKNTCLVIIVLLVFIIAGGAYKFLVTGSTTQSTDDRTSILLTPGERDLVLLEMRTFLISVQAITQGVTENDMVRVADAARAVGKSAQVEVPGTLIGKLPLEFKKLGFDTHEKFDLLAINARDQGDAQQVLVQLAELMQNCVACHAAYRLDATQP